jgi:glucokinase
MASGTAIGREGTDAGRREPSSALGRAVAQRGVVTGEEVTALAVEGDPVAGLVMAAIGRNLGAGLASVVNIFEPELIVVGGGAAAAGDLLLDPAREMVAQRALRPGRDTVRIVPAALGEEAGMIGAAVFALAGGEV